MDEGIQLDCASMGTDYSSNKTVIIKEGETGISGIYTYEELRIMDIVVIREGEN